MILTGSSCPEESDAGRAGVSARVSLSGQSGATPHEGSHSASHFMEKPMSSIDMIMENTQEPKQRNRCVVRLRTTKWADKSGLHIKKSLTFLRRKSEGFNILEEDTGAAGVEEILPRILNMDECQDGIYEVVMCNERHDYETGYVDGYDYRLVAAN